MGRWVHERVFDHNPFVQDFIKYECRDCEEGQKTFCLISRATDENGNGYAVKIGEFPEYHLEVPQSLEKLLGDEHKIFLKGLRCEKHGLGIGAFTYYRRVVESQKSHLIEEILHVAERLVLPSDVRDKLRQASTERQFSRAIDAIGSAIPQSLLVDSHNPLKLLHQALSIGVHATDDNSCLKIAHSIRVVLADFSERIRLALRRQVELRSAVSEIMSFNADAKRKAKLRQKEDTSETH